MNLDTTFLHSKLARRIFWLFVWCAIVPITVLAVISLRNVTDQIREESHRQLHQNSREQAMIVFERLSFLQADLKLLARTVSSNPNRAADFSLAVSNELTTDLQNRLHGLELVTAEGEHQVLFGGTNHRFEFTEAEQKFFRTGKNVLYTLPCGTQRCIFLSRELVAGHPEQGVLVAEINPSYLWDSESLPRDMDVCVLDPNGQILFCSGQVPYSFPAQVTRSFSGEFEWKNHGQEYIANYWNLPLESSFFVSHWTIVSSKPKPFFLAPLVRFKNSFLLVYLLAIWIVLLLSLVQIRRNLVPLSRLIKGTRELSLGNLETRVHVESKDEFQELARSFNSMAGRLEKQVNSLKIFNEIDRGILSAWNIEKILDTLSGRLGGLIPLDLVSITLLDAGESSAALTYIYDSNLNPAKSEELTDMPADEVEEICKQSHLSFTINVENLPKCLTPLAGRGMNSFLVVPILMEGRLSAVLSLGRAIDSPWNEEDKEHARKLADQLAVALSNSRLVVQLEQLQWGTLTALARAIDAKSPWTMGHSERVTTFAVKIATEMGLSARELDIIRRGGLLHDIGKIGIPVSILDKPGRLTDEEIKTMREHVNIGARILEPIPGLAESMPIVLQHHEWINGGGYPNGISGNQVTLHARIFAVADCFDALISDRPYRPGMTLTRAMEIILEGTGKQFDPSIVEVFQRLMRRESILGTKEEVERPLLVVR